MNAQRLLLVGFVALGIFALLQILLLPLKMSQKEHASRIFTPEFREFFEKYPVPPNWGKSFPRHRVVTTQLPTMISSTDKARLEVTMSQDNVAVLTHRPGVAALIATVGDHADTLWVWIDAAEVKKFGPQ